MFTTTTTKEEKENVVHIRFGDEMKRVMCWEESNNLRKSPLSEIQERYSQKQDKSSKHLSQHIEIEFQREVVEQTSSQSLKINLVDRTNRQWAIEISRYYFEVLKKK